MVQKKTYLATHAIFLSLEVLALDCCKNLAQMLLTIHLVPNQFQSCNAFKCESVHCIKIHRGKVSRYSI